MFVVFKLVAEVEIKICERIRVAHSTSLVLNQRKQIKCDKANLFISKTVVLTENFYKTKVSLIIYYKKVYTNYVAPSTSFVQN